MVKLIVTDVDDTLVPEAGSEIMRFLSWQIMVQISGAVNIRHQ